MTSEVRQAARAYLALGWCVIPVLPREKCPGWDGYRQTDWDKLRLTTVDLSRYFSPMSNVGVLLGEPSGHLVDVDLDCAEAIELAPRFLPLTWTFGRRSKRRSHWLYLAKGATTDQFRAPAPPAEKAPMLVELRGGGIDGKAFQTVFPPSIHSDSGELIEWEEDGDAHEEPMHLEAAKLRARVAKLAAASLAFRCAGRSAAEAWLEGADCPALPPAAATHIRQWWGLSPPKHARVERIGKTVPPDVEERARRYLARMPPAISGSGGHVQTLLAAEHLVRGFGLDDATAFELLATYYSPRCQPPWSERELHHKVSEARNQGTAVAWGQHLEGQRRHG
jgi:hypothetical protein